MISQVARVFIGERSCSFFVGEFFALQLATTYPCWFHVRGFPVPFAAWRFLTKSRSTFRWKAGCFKHLFVFKAKTTGTAVRRSASHHRVHHTQCVSKRPPGGFVFCYAVVPVFSVPKHRNCYGLDRRSFIKLLGSRCVASASSCRVTRRRGSRDQGNFKRVSVCEF